MTIMSTLAACGGGAGSKSSSQPGTEVKEFSIEPEKEIENADFRVTKIRKVVLNEDLSNIGQFKENINNWLVRVEAKTKLTVKSVIKCQRFEKGENLISQASFDESGVAEVNLTISAQDPLKVDFECSLPGKEAVTVTLRKSLIISDKRNMIAASLSDTSVIETIVLEKDAVLITDGKTVTLTFNELISEGGKIVTFEEDKDFKSPDDQIGKSGGIINLVTEKARGELFVELRGLPGGAQTKIKPQISHTPHAGSELNGRESESRKSCLGKQGYQGFQGEKGFQGLKGGDTGMIFFRSIDESTIKLEISYHPGAGQTGGLGGKGGSGGRGGKGGVYVKNFTTRTNCPDGLPGPQGPDGIQGDKGLSGNNQTSSVVFQHENIFKEFDSNWKN